MSKTGHLVARCEPEVKDFLEFCVAHESESGIETNESRVIVAALKYYIELRTGISFEEFCKIAHEVEKSI